MVDIIPFFWQSNESFIAYSSVLPGNAYYFFKCIDKMLINGGGYKDDVL